MSAALFIFFVLLIGAWFVVKFFMHPAGQSHGMGMGCGGGHGHGSPDEHRPTEQSHEHGEAPLGHPAEHPEGQEPAHAGRHRGC